MASVSYSTTFAFSASIGEVLSIQVDGAAVTEIETTHLTSTDAVKTWLPGFVDWQGASLTINYAKAQLNTLIGQLRSTATATLTLADGSTLAGSAFLKSVAQIDVPEDGRVTVQLAIRWAGKPTWTSAA